MFVLYLLQVIVRSFHLFLRTSLSHTPCTAPSIRQCYLSYPQRYWTLSPPSLSPPPSSPTLAPPPPPQPSDSTTDGAGTLFNFETLFNTFRSNFQHYYYQRYQQHKESHSDYLSSNAHHLSNSSKVPNTEAKYNNNLYQDESVMPHTHTLVVEEEGMERCRQLDHECALKHGRSPYKSDILTPRTGS